jgi:hypothetical protein
MLVKFEARPNYLFAEFSGEFVLNEALEHFKQLEAERSRAGTRLVMVDARNVTGEMSILSRFTMGETLAEFHAIQRIVFVARQDQVLPDRFMQTVARNRGLMGQVFFEIPDAEAWLLATT